MPKTCKQCTSIIPSRIKIDGKTYNLNSRKNCLSCVPIGSRLKNLSTEELDIRNRDKQRQWCKRKTKELGRHPLTHRRDRRKKWLVEILGGGCQICGYNRCSKNLTFHHLSNKKFAIGSVALQLVAPDVIGEIIKCVMVCHNCHGEIHDGLIMIDFKKLNAFVRSILNQYRLMTWNDILP